MKKSILVIVGLSGMAMLTLFTFSLSKDTQHLSGKDFLEKYNSTSDSVLFDVRTPAEFSTGHIEGAVNIDIQNSSFVSEIRKLDPHKVYFVYCRSGSRSAQAVSVMKAQGIQTVYELQGGIVSNTGSVALVRGNKDYLERGK